MSILPITYTGERVLHQPTQLVNLKDLPKLQGVIDSMIETMYKRNGIGIAANQVGQHLSIAIINHEAWGGTEDVAIINPTLTAAKKTKWFEEGCLSVPGSFGWVERAERVRVKAFDRKGKKLDIKAKGLLAHVLQHEVDHLKGIVFIDKAERIQNTTTEYAI